MQKHRNTGPACLGHGRYGMPAPSCSALGSILSIPRPEGSREVAGRLWARRTDIKSGSGRRASILLSSLSVAAEVPRSMRSLGNSTCSRHLCCFFLALSGSMPTRVISAHRPLAFVRDARIGVRWENLFPLVPLLPHPRVSISCQIGNFTADFDDQLGNNLES